MLETVEGGTCQDMEKDRPTKGHSHSGDGRGRDLSGHGKQVTKQGGTYKLETAEGGGGGGVVRTQKETNQPRGTHNLEMAEGGTCQDMERNQPTKGHLHSGDGRGRNLSGHRKKVTEQGTLTSWRQQRVGLLRTQKETDQLRVRGTHKLETTEGGTCWDIERNQLSKGHSHPGDRRGGYLSGHRWKLTSTD